ncbi:hypothetical protein CDL15_Pgr000993 [Punica granatum]|uniref:Uncharacterized protein n=1 Tax=Punica granatum TaxID=22663 RepID=A0A218XHZ4_PUNGR|nr:hypothetical protein CDL15_Pgr000993 [Punica granatum]
MESEGESGSMKALGGGQVCQICSDSVGTAVDGSSSPSRGGVQTSCLDLIRCSSINRIQYTRFTAPFDDRWLD